jgi:glycosyltransferase involved in cell wall biosynthesis
MLFSILIANYNNGHFFKDCYQSIIQQSYANWEVIIVDDCSTDDSVEVIEGIIGNDLRFKIFHNTENQGCGFTKKECAKLAHGEILGFLDPDDAIKCDALAVMVEAHLNNKEASIITSKYELVDLDMKFIKHSIYGCNIPEGKSYLTYSSGAMTHFATFKKDKYEQSGGINPIMKRAVDQDLYYKLEEQGKHLFLDKFLYSYRIHETSISNNENLYKAEYWHFYAMQKAYNRRRRLHLQLDNFSKKYLNKFASNYYIERFEKIKGKPKFCAKFYFISKAIWLDPFDRFEFKIKSLILIFLGRI